MAEKLASLQDQFLNAVRRAHMPVSVFVTKGVKLQGLIPWFDNFSLLLRRDGQEQLVYKHSIATIMPAGELADFEQYQLPVAAKASLQDRFLLGLAEEKVPVTTYLVNGVMLQGEIAGFDQYSLVLRRGHLIQLVYKHALSTIQPDIPVRIAREETGDRQVEAAD